ncbi:MAG: winged helix-turn-helix domain-containing protein [Nitrososphaerales archaeon]
MKYRSRTEIIDMILQTSRSGTTKTKIMYKAYLSYTQVKEYLSFMLENDLIMYEEGSHLYRVTEKGLHFLHTYSEISDMIIPKPVNR